MAAHMTRLCCRALTLNAVYKRVKLKSFLTNDVLSSQTAWQPRLCFGTRGRHTMQDVHIHIPVDRLKVSYSKSSGPGGQHVNKVSTRAEVRFHVHTADWIPEDVRQRIFEKNKNSINKAGELMVTSELSRSQQRNLSDCIQKISTIIAKASQKPHEPSAEDVALRTDRLERRKNEQLKQKKIHSLIKRSRRVDFD